jgi:ferredoxin
MTRLNLARYPWIKSLLLSRWPQFLTHAVLLAGFIFTILVGLLGPVVGSHNFAVIFVWIVWWSALKLFFIPLGGRSWCSICPIPMPGEWLQRGGILKSTGQGWGLGKRWPKFLRGNWIQAGVFLLIGLFSAVILTSARITALVLLAVILLSLALSLLYERRAFCRYICPIGGFTGLYALAAPLEVRSIDPSVCAGEAGKIHYASCPWGINPLALKANTNCGLCMECLRVCPNDNIAVNLRPFGSDLGPQTKLRLDETFLGLVMLSSVLVDAAIFLGPWGALKSAAYTIGSIPWLFFTTVFLGISLAVIPGLYTLAIWTGQQLSKSQIPFRKTLAQQGQVLIPLGLMAWIAFTISFAFTKFSYVLPVLSDPIGLGWNLLALGKPAWTVDINLIYLILQAAALVGGLAWSSRVALRLADRTSPHKQSLPMIGFCMLFTLVMLWLLIG